MEAIRPFGVGVGGWLVSASWEVFVGWLRSVTNFELLFVAFCVPLTRLAALLG